METDLGFTDELNINIGEDWADPFIGLEWRPRRGKWEYLLEADIGGGNDADSVWQFMLGATYHYSDRYAVSAGYRALDIEYREEFIFDGILEGLQIGFMFKF